MTIPNKHTVEERFSKSIQTYKKHAQVQKVLCECFASTLFSYSFPFHNVFEIGCGTGFLTEQILKQVCPQTYIANDIAQIMQPEIAQLASDYHIQNLTFLPGDAEIIEFPHELDAIISTSTVQWFHNLPAFFTKANAALQPEGILAFSTFGLQNFIEIRETLDKGLDYISESKIREYLEPYFSIIACNEWIEKLWFDSPVEVLHHIKQTGVSGFGGTYMGKNNLVQFIETYSKNYADNGKVCLTYNPIMFIAKKK